MREAPARARVPETGATGLGSPLGTPSRSETECACLERALVAGPSGLRHAGRSNLGGVNDGLTTAPELARELRVHPKRLRQAIRDYRLVPAHQHGKRYQLDADDVARIRSHPAVRALPRR